MLRTGGGEIIVNRRNHKRFLFVGHCVSMSRCCNNCQETLGVTRIRCKTCSDFELCVLCFSNGAEIGPHKSHHGYHFEDQGSFPVFPPLEGDLNPWTAKEEVLLLDAIEQFGFGNFEDISKHIETRSAEETRDHYLQRYVFGAIGRATWPAPAKAGAFESRLVAKDHTGPDFGPLSPSLTARLPPLQIQQDEAMQLGYMTNRDDFETEFDNDAELLISHLQLNSTGDEDIDIALKLAQVDMYQRRLRDRVRRKRLVRDYQLAQEFFIPIKKGGVEVSKKITEHKRKLIKSDRDLLERFRTLSRFHTFNEQEQFLKNLSRTRQLRTRIRELLKYRKNGLTRSEECIEYERQRYRREKKKDDRKRSESFSIGGDEPDASPTATGSGDEDDPISMAARSTARKRKRKFKFQRLKKHTPGVLLKRAAWRASLGLS